MKIVSQWGAKSGNIIKEWHPISDSEVQRYGGIQISLLFILICTIHRPTVCMDTKISIVQTNI